MNIQCPRCGFSRDVPESRLPRGAAVATCPRCSCRFRLDSRVDGAPAAPEEDPRLAASRAYAREAARLEREAGLPGGGSAEPCRNPWQCAPGSAGWIASFAQTVLAVMFQAQRFFPALRATDSPLRPLGFYAILCVFQTVCERFWAWMLVGALSPGADADTEKWLALLGTDSSLPLSVLLRTGILCAQLYIACALVYAAVRLLAPERASFTLVFQVLAYSFAPAVLCVVPGLGSLIGLAWGLGLMVAGLRMALGLNWAQAVAAFLPLVFIGAFMLMQVISLLQA